MAFQTSIESVRFCKLIPGTDAGEGRPRCIRWQPPAQASGAAGHTEPRRWSSLSFGFAGQTGLRPDVNGLVSAGVLLAPASPLHQKSPQLFVRLDPQHGVDPVFV